MELTTEQVIEMDKKKIEEAKAKADASFDPVDIEKALHDVYDIEERATIEFILLSEPAKACKENRQVYTDMIELALPQTNLTPEVKSLFESTWKFTKTDYGYIYHFSPELKWDIKIPIRIYVYSTKFRLFENPNRVWGTTEGFKIPNPFNEYWKLRHIIRHKLKNNKPLSSDKL